MEWAVLEQMLASHWGCVARTTIQLAILELTSIRPVISLIRMTWSDLSHRLVGLVVILLLRRTLDRLFGLVVKASASRAEGPRFESR